MLPSVILGAGGPAEEAETQRLVDARFASRLFARDSAIWGETAQEEAGQRLGWVDAYAHGVPIVAAAEALRADLLARGVDRVVLCGMGGSSLAPEVITRRDWAPLVVLDSTHPAQVRRALREVERTVVVVSSKSGSTIETRSQLAAFEAAFAEAGIEPSERIVVVTDPGSGLEADAHERDYRVFLADPQVGGRFSALTAFGLVPSVLAGADGRALLSEAADAADALRADDSGNPALRLAGALVAALPQRYLFGCFESRVQGIGLPDWVEQLVAESTGKDGRGLLPIALDPGSPEVHGRLPETMLLVELSPDAGLEEVPVGTVAVAGPLGAQFLLWEVATAAIGYLIGVNPFDQPDVEAAKVAARAALGSAGSDSALATEEVPTADRVAELRGALDPEGYLVIQAYLDRETETPVAELRAALAEALRAPVALGFGPRYLHSTGQFHKGGPARGAFLQIVDDATEDLAIPGSRNGFAELIAAQAAGDREVLRGHGRPVVTIAERDVPALLAALR